MITVKNVSLSKASFVKFRAQSMDFVEVSNPRALLEVSLRKFTCLTVGDTICIPYHDKRFYLDVREVQPNGAASIIETDCNVDFEEPLGYQDSKYAQYERDKKETAAKAVAGVGGQGDSAASRPRTLQKARIETPEEQAAAAAKFTAFSGSAKRIDGKLPPQEKSAAGTESKSGGGNGNVAGAGASAGSNVSEAKNAGVDAQAPVAAPVFKSRIGDKYSKKKTAVSAFTGPARKLNS